MLQESLIIAAVALAAGVLPLVIKRSDRVLHLCIAFATGIFLGMVFLDLLPQVGGLAPPAGGQAMAGEDSPGLHGDLTLWVCVLIGVVGLYLIENLILPLGEASEDHRHATVGYATFVGLSVHALTAGLGLAATVGRPSLTVPFFVSIVSHKVAESFSLTTVFMLAGFRLSKILWMIVLFSLVTPAGVHLGTWVVSMMDSSGLEILTALAAGTFLFVALCDLLPEVFHHRVDAGLKVLLLAGGIAASLITHQFQGA